MAQLAGVPLVDPTPTFFQFTAVGANCPVPMGPIGHTGLSAQAFREDDIAIQIEKASQTELARSVAQLQEENASLKEDLGFLRRLMSSRRSARAPTRWRRA